MVEITALDAPHRRDNAHASIDLIGPLHEIHPAPPRVAAVKRTPLGGGAKRMMDIVVASLALAVLAIPFLIIAIAIKIESPGDVFFLQRRGGYRGRPFLVIKFRTMTVSEDGQDIVQAVRGDPRVTRLGSWLRKLSIDELPQIFNVLRGEMSLVGPRPHAVAHDRSFRHIDPRYGRRFRARPGVTGLAQVCGCRGLTRDAGDVRRRVDLDLRYIERWSLWLDCWIILRTAFVLFRDQNAT